MGLGDGWSQAKYGDYFELGYRLKEECYEILTLKFVIKKLAFLHNSLIPTLNYFHTLFQFSEIFRVN